MADFFKLVGGTDPVVTSLGTMTQGLGYPLREVEPSTGGGTVSVVTEEVFESANFTDQNPTGLGIDTPVLFGAPSATDEWSVDAGGVLTCLVADEYGFRFKVAIGRTGQQAESQIYLRAVLNGVPVGNSIHTIVDNPRIEISLGIETTGNFAVNDTLSFEFVRDTDGNNSGGLVAGIPEVAGWASSPSAVIQITRTYAIET